MAARSPPRFPLAPLLAAATGTQRGHRGLEQHAAPAAPPDPSRRSKPSPRRPKPPAGRQTSSIPRSNSHSRPGRAMDTVKAVQNYVVKMASCVSGMKILLLDAETVSFVGSLRKTEGCCRARGLPCLVVHLPFVVPAPPDTYCLGRGHAVDAAYARDVPNRQGGQPEPREDAPPKMCGFSLAVHHGWGSIDSPPPAPREVFSNILKKSAIERLAEVDEYEVVREVQEFFADYAAINPDFYSLNLGLPRYPLHGDSLHSWDGRTFQRAVDGVSAVLLSLKKRPLIRYAKCSLMAQKLAQEINVRLPLDAAVERTSDNCVRTTASGPALLSQEVVLSADQDPFYRKNMYNNLGDLGANIKAYVDEYQVKTKSNMKIDSIMDMKRFVEEYPEFRKLSGNVSKHVALVGELSRLVTRGKLLEVGELEQSIACSDNHTQHLRAVQAAIARTEIGPESKLRLVMLYALRYERTPANAISMLIGQLTQAGLGEKYTQLVSSVLRYAGSDQRQDDLFANENILSRGKSVLQGLKGVENIYTQHRPQLAEVLDLMVRSRLKDSSYPFVEGSTKDKPQDIIVFVVGGVTYEEARYVAQFNADTPAVRVVLGGTAVHNTTSFLDEVQDAVSRTSAQGGGGLGNVARSARTLSR
ncbi:MAG: Sec1-like protein [Olpidium bornovanus]|uniref:Sec1-like protein n=1 Tax=Olpidium bornovanus TaxID=278681 RepID=A0A8H7ZQC0_9FUNG|nr:MAG: Sec1-like protein [Olpidium bornovanus]